MCTWMHIRFTCIHFRYTCRCNVYGDIHVDTHVGVNVWYRVHADVYVNVDIHVHVQFSPAFRNFPWLLQLSFTITTFPPLTSGGVETVFDRFSLSCQKSFRQLQIAVLLSILSGQPSKMAWQGGPIYGRFKEFPLYHAKSLLARSNCMKEYFSSIKRWDQRCYFDNYMGSLPRADRIQYSNFYRGHNLATVTDWEGGHNCHLYHALNGSVQPRVQRGNTFSRCVRHCGDWRHQRRRV